MYKVTYRTVRPNKFIHFYPRPQVIKELIDVEKRAGRLKHEHTGFSEDFLIKSYVAIWASKKDLYNFNSKPEVQRFIKRKKFYDQENEHYTNVLTENING